jgi:hypothetical protein
VLLEGVPAIVGNEVFNKRKEIIITELLDGLILFK